MLDTSELLKGHVDYSRRTEPRFQSIGEGELTVIDPPRPERLAASVIDVSRSGLQVEIAARVESGSIIELHLQKVRVSGKVGSCREQSDGSYRIGVVTSHVTSRV